MSSHVIGLDLVKVYSQPKRDKASYLRTLAWGDAVTLLAQTADHIQIGLPHYVEQPDGSFIQQQVVGYIVPNSASKKLLSQAVIPKADSKVLKVDFIDVQQGDAAVIETPDDQVILLDGGDNQLFARYLASRFPGTTSTAPKAIDCIVVTHGDADHFAGLTEIHDSEKHRSPAKRLFMKPARVYHNGIVKRPSSADEALGETYSQGDRKIIVGLEDDLLQVSDSEMNKPFLAWKRALASYAPQLVKRLKWGSKGDFAFLQNKDIAVEVLGPIETTLGTKRGLEYLREPRSRYTESTKAKADKKGSWSDSHTINGHSIILKLTYGAARFLFSGDLNEESGDFLVEAHRRGDINLEADVFKVPHHGSDDFSIEFLKAVAPAISVISSGDESERKEYIHPRSTLVGALGKYSRLDTPLIFVTEMVAFFKAIGWSRKDAPKGKADNEPSFYAFQRTAFGIVKVRTDGDRMLVFTNSGLAEMKEDYAFKLFGDRAPIPAEVISI